MRPYGGTQGHVAKLMDLSDMVATDNGRYRFQKDWFSHHIANWQDLFSRVGWDRTTAKTVVEIGCFEGRATVWILENLIDTSNSAVHCIDSFGGGVEHGGIDFQQVKRNFTDNVAATGKGDRVHLHQGTSFDKLTELYTQGVCADFVYLDGGHEAPDVLSDLVLAHHLTKIGGLVICDDYVWRMEPTSKIDILNNPKFAIDSFVNIYRRKVELFIDMPLHQFAFKRVG